MPNPTLHILLVEDNQDDARLVTERLREIQDQRFELHNAASLSEALSVLEVRNFDLILLDISLPDASGLDGLELLQLVEDVPPIIIRSRSNDRELAIKALKLGAEDCLIKGEQGPDKFLRSIRFAIERHRLRTDLERQRGELIEARRRLDWIIGSVPVAIVVVTEDGRIQFSNRSAEELFGEAWGNLLHRRLEFPTAPDATEELEIARPDDSVRFAAFRSAPITWGGTAAKLVSLLDVTESVTAKAALVESEERFRSTFESAVHGIAIIDMEGRYLRVNDAFCAIVGYDADELTASYSYLELTHPDDVALNAAYTKRLLAGEISSFQVEKRYIRKGGGEVSVMLAVGLSHRADGRPLHYVAQIVDLTARKDAENQLRQAQKMEAVGQLTGGIAHDFNNILGVVLGNLQLIQRLGGTDDTVAKLAQDGVEAVMRGASLTKRLLAFSRADAGTPKVLGMNRLVADMVEMLERSLGEAVEVNVSLKAAPDRIRVDPSQFEAMLLNLSLNARDAMSGVGHLTIETSNSNLDVADPLNNRDPKRYVCLTVTDTGKGIPAKLRSRIFEPFFTTKEAGAGTGLGLSMAYSFVHQLKGNITLSSSEGRGTSFHIHIPRDESDEETEQDDRPHNGDVRGGKEAILLVEDDESFRTISTRLLEELGYSVITAIDAVTALRALENHPEIELLLTDIVLPGGMNGHQIAKYARRRNPGLKILLTSGYPRNAFETGREFPVIMKPYFAQALDKAVRSVLETTDLGDQAVNTAIF